MARVEDIYPLTPLQEGMLYHALEGGADGSYRVQVELLLRGRLEPDLLAETWRLLARRHDLLRAGVAWNGVKSPLLVVRDEPAIPIEHSDWRQLDPAARDRARDEQLERELSRGFDLEKAPLLRIAVGRLEDERHSLAITAHHLILDGWSNAQLIADSLAVYDALATGRPADLPPAPPFRDYVAWLRGRDPAESERRWRAHLAGVPSAPDPPAATRRERAGAGHVQRRRELPVAELEAFGRRHGLTLNTLVQGAWALLLHRYSGERDVVHGVTLATRPAELPGVEAMLGPLINTVPARATIDRDAALPGWLAALQQRAAELREHDSASLVDVHAWSGLGRGETLFTTLLIFQNYPVDDAAAGPRTLELVGSRSSDPTNYPLTLVAVAAGGVLSLELSAARSAYVPEAAEQLLSELSRLLAAIARGDDARLADALAAAPDADGRARGLANTGPSPAPSAEPLLAGLERHAAAATALVCGDERISYGELTQRVTGLAAALRERGVGPESLVAICLPRSCDMVVAVLATLRAGGAYVPLDPEYPLERLRLMLEDSGAGVLVALADDARRLGADAARVVPPDASGGAAPADQPPTGDAAYVIYTSGSTGRPKGVTVSRRNLAAFLAAMDDELRPRAGGRWLAVSSLSFDISVLELVWALTRGFEVVLASATDRPREIAALLARHHPSHLQCTPSLAAMLVADDDALTGLAALDVLLLGGEALPPALARRLLAHGVRDLRNVYGPTEATVWATVQHVTDPPSRPLPIGRRLASATAYVIDADGEPVAPGVKGELVIGGPAVTRGYWRRPGLTADRFRPDPVDAPGDRVYRTGDVAAVCFDGTLEFFGRADDQVKLRGHRIELGEIEHALAQHPAVGQAAAAVHELAEDDQRLIAYAVPAAGADPGADELLDHLRTRLPAPMVPADLVLLEHLPRTPNGKLARDRLPAPPRRVQGAAARGETRFDDPLEDQIAAAWEPLLQQAPAGPDDGFFNLGGHSLLAVRLLAVLRRDLGAPLTLGALLTEPTVRGMAAAVRNAIAAGNGGALPPELGAEASLPADLERASWGPASEHPGSFVTGATGFLGAFVTAAALESADGPVHCLVRGDDPGAARERTITALTALRLWDASYDERLHVLAGDLRRPAFGLDHAGYARLAGEIGSIFHCGAIVNFAYPYRVIAPTVVGGTIEALRLTAASGATLHHVSTLGLAPHSWEQFDETSFPAAGDVEPIGYLQSKWVAEQLVRSAAVRGARVVVHRPANLFSDTRTGACNRASILWRLVAASLRLGVAPQYSWDVFTAPVDRVAAAIVGSRPAAGATLHLVDGAPLPFADILDWIEAAGYPLERLPLEEWRRRAVAAATGSDDALHALLAVLPEHDDPRHAGTSRIGTAATEPLLAALGIPSLRAEPQHVAAALEYLVGVSSALAL